MSSSRTPAVYSAALNLHAVPPDHFAVPGGGGFGDALLGFEVGVDHAEALGVAEGPLEVVVQRPLVECSDVAAFFDGAVEAGEKATKQFDAGRVVTLAVGSRFGVVADAIFGDVHLWVAVLLGHPLHE